MMVANSSNLIVTVKPANQRTSMGPRRGSFSRNSNMSHLSSSTRSHTESEDLEDEDEIRSHQLLEEADQLNNHHGSSRRGYNASGSSRKNVLHL
jgi:partitioning defective protein 6